MRLWLKILIACILTPTIVIGTVTLFDMYITWKPFSETVIANFDSIEDGQRFLILVSQLTILAFVIGVIIAED